MPGLVNVGYCWGLRIYLQVLDGNDTCCVVRYGAITVDEAMVFDKALSEAELKPIFEDGIDGAMSVDSIEKLAATWGNVKTQY